MHVFSRNCEDKSPAYADVAAHVLAALDKTGSADALVAGSRPRLNVSRVAVSAAEGKSGGDSQARADMTTGLFSENQAVNSDVIGGYMQVDDIILDGEVVGVGPPPLQGGSRPLLAFQELATRSRGPTSAEEAA